VTTAIGIGVAAMRGQSRGFLCNLGLHGRAGTTDTTAKRNGFLLLSLKVRETNA
jgi:hypothetical protein